MDADQNTNYGPQRPDSMGEGRNSTSQIEDVFAIVELLKKFRLYEHQTTGESNDVVKGLQAEAKKIITELKFEPKSPGFKSMLAINDYSEKKNWKFKMAGQFPNIGKLKGNGTKKTILQHAVENYSEADLRVKESLKDVIMCLIANCPDLIIYAKEGAAPLLSVILMQSEDLVEAMLKRIEKTGEEEQKRKEENEKTVRWVHKQLGGIDFSAIGRGRILCTWSVYHVAALMLNPKLFGIFLKYCGELCFKRGKHGRFGDNVLHALVRYGSRAPSKIDDIIKMLKGLHQLEDSKHRKAIHDLWMETNESGLTPLQLAAKKGQHQIFEFIMSLEMLYYFRDGDEDCFDVTEIDTVPSKDTVKSATVKDRSTYKTNPDENQNRTNQGGNQNGTIPDGHQNSIIQNGGQIETIPSGNQNGAIPDENQNENFPDEDNSSPVGKKVDVHKPVLHLIRYVPDKYSIPIVNMPAVKTVIDTKWKSYQFFIFVWFVIHLLVMGLCAWYAVIRAQLTNPFVKDQSFKVERAYGLGVCILIYGIFCLVMQVIRNINKLRRKRYQKFHWRYITSSFMFPWFFGLFGLLIIIDFTVACVLASYDNFVLPYVLIIGWGLSLYFLQVINYFSVFVVMIQRLSSIMIQFAIVTTLFMVGFSAAAYLALYNVELENNDDTFKHFGKTVFKMLTIMIGLGDIDVVFESEYLIMTISIFVLFSLLTTILLLNALIAYMSEICSLIAEYGKRGSISSKVYARLQRVTVIVQLEDFLPIFLMQKGETTDALTSFPNERRKYIILRPPDEPQADSPLENEEDNNEKLESSKEKSSNWDLRDPIKNNKVFPDKVRTLEITEITQAYCEHECIFCANKGLISSKIVK